MTLGLDASYPLLRSRLSNLYLNLGFERKRFDNQSGGTITTNYGVDSLTLGLFGNRFDNFFGGGASTASLSLVGGRVDLEGSPNQAADLASVHTQGNYARLNYAVARQQVLTSSLALYAAVSGQLDSGNLDSGEKFYLGGSGGVRAYPASEAGGAEGQLLSVELRMKLPSSLDLTGFSGQQHRRRQPPEPLWTEGRRSRPGVAGPRWHQYQVRLGAAHRRQPQSDFHRPGSGRQQDPEPFLALSQPALLKAEVTT